MATPSRNYDLAWPEQNNTSVLREDRLHRGPKSLLPLLTQGGTAASNVTAAGMSSSAQHPINEPHCGMHGRPCQLHWQCSPIHCVGYDVDNKVSV
jgi:hypothetical protein